MNPCPGEGLTAAQLLAHFGMFGACSHGVLSDVPLLVSKPFAAIKKQLLPFTGALAGQAPPAAKAVPALKMQAIKNAIRSSLTVNVSLSKFSCSVQLMLRSASLSTR
jgi:hypothetical protein